MWWIRRSQWIIKVAVLVEKEQMPPSIFIITGCV
jgi:hypothetical protein